jgi:signal transduction histidine kinase
VVHSRPAKIKQVFHGILLNAAQASQPGQEIIVTAARDDDDVLVRIVDEGAGIDADTRTHLFEPFFTTRNVGAGRGLGLAVSYGIVRQHSGNIEVDTQPGRGSEFRIRLPMRQKPSEP